MEVIVKIIKESSVSDPVAEFEFNVESATLARLEHPNIVRLIGAGHSPRLFLILENLLGGTLSNLLHQKKESMLRKRPCFTLSEVLLKARELANALQHMHAGCSPGATFLHRDLKPDNIGFTTNGSLKLIDFGLSTCIRTGTRADDVFEMTGYTGSLRYMAPEVALRQPYNEKCDVYSFGIILWQMARSKVPYEGLTSQTFLQHVVVNDLVEPDLDLTGYTDGGIVANNPSVIAVTKAMAHYPHITARNVVVLSIGSGRFPRHAQVFHNGEKDVKWSPTGNQELWRADWGIKQWLPFMLDLLLEGDTVTIEMVMHYLLGNSGLYHRLDPRLPSAVAIDDVAAIPDLISFGESLDIEATLKFVDKHFASDDLQSIEDNMITNSLDSASSYNMAWERLR
eukprot:gene799-885_t